MPTLTAAARFPLPARIAIGCLGAVALGSVALGGFYTVHERERAVVTRNGAFSYVASPGFHLKIPFLDGVESFDLSVRSIAMEKLETFTVDNQHVDVDMIVQYHVVPGEVERVFRETRDYEQRLRTMAVDRMKIALGKRNIAELPEQRGAIAMEVLQKIRDEAQRLYGLEVSDVQLGNIQYSPAFRAAVDASAVAKAQVEQAHQQQRQAEVTAQSARIQAEGQANAAIEAAKGAAESRLLAARSEAQAIELRGRAEATTIALRGEAEAKSMRAQAEALGSNPNLVALEQARRWSGALPTQMLSGVPVPFLNLGGGR